MRSSSVNSTGAKNTIGDKGLSFNSAFHNHVNHGTFWRPGVIYTNFYFEALVRPDGIGQYIISAGYGGAHCLLFGVNSVSNGYCSLTGNVFFDGVGTSFTSVEGIPVGKDARVAVCGDASTGIITLIINGVPVAIATGWGGQRRTPAETDSQMFIGGSDHQNFGGFIKVIRHFEGVLPYANPHQVVINPNPRFMGLTAVVNGSTLVQPQFLADYRTGLTKDWSLGLDGVKHDGELAETISIGNAGGTAFDFAPGANVDETKLPVWVTSKTDISHSETPATPPVGVRIFDSFGRANSLKDQVAFNLGSTEVGAKTWLTSAYGILNGKAFPSSTAAGIALVTDTAVDGRVKISKDRNGNLPAGIGASFGVVFRAVDGNNYEQLTVDPFGSAYVYQYVGGVYTGHLGPVSFGTSWTSAETEFTGSSVVIKADGVTKATQTMTANLTGTGKGFFSNQPLVKVNTFEVY